MHTLTTLSSARRMKMKATRDTWSAGLRLPGGDTGNLYREVDIKSTVEQILPETCGSTESSRRAGRTTRMTKIKADVRLITKLSAYLRRIFRNFAIWKY